MSEETKTPLLILSIVAVVAIVGIVGMFNVVKSSKVSAVESVGSEMLAAEGDLTGQADASLLCRDSDGGINYYEKGTTCIGRSTCKTDYCKTNSTVVEYYCGPDKLRILIIGTTCPYNCSDGACLIPIVENVTQG